MKIPKILQVTRQYHRRLTNAGITVYIATVPPIFNPDGSLSPHDAQIRLLNKRIRGSWPKRHIEFYTGITPADFLPDGMHFNTAGQTKRALAAAAALLR